MANANPYSNFSTLLYMSYQFSELPMKSGKSIYKGEFFTCFLMIYVHISTYKQVFKSLYSFTKYKTMERIKIRDLNHPINVWQSPTPFLLLRSNETSSGLLFGRWTKRQDRMGLIHGIFRRKNLVTHSLLHILYTLLLKLCFENMIFQSMWQCVSVQ